MTSKYAFAGEGATLGDESSGAGFGKKAARSDLSDEGIAKLTYAFL